MLSVENLSIKFGGLVAVSNLNLTINNKEIVGLIGPNGAGKTTVFNMLTGVYSPTEGNICYLGENIEGLKPYVINEKKIARTFQNIRLFKEMSILDNVKISFNSKIKYNIFDIIFRSKKFKSEESIIEETSLKLLKAFNLDFKKDELAKNLSYGEQRKLEIVRALATSPSLLLLDEPAAGMNGNETLELMEMIRWIKSEFNISILLIEHDMNLVMGICERIIVLDYGKKIAEGTPKQIKNNKKVIEAYLGEGA